jgi:hypothetical protein
MFFRRATPKQFNFDEMISNLSEFKFQTKRESGGRVLVTRAGCGAMVEDAGNGAVKVDKAGVLVANEIAMLVNRGYQMFLHTPTGKELPALSTHLERLHAFDEDLREGLGITSLYNTSLGTTTDEHLYDRVEERDDPPQSRPWEKK